MQPNTSTQRQQEWCILWGFLFDTTQKNSFAPAPAVAPPPYLPVARIICSRNPEPVHVENVVLVKSLLILESHHLPNPSGRIFLSHQLGSQKFSLRNVGQTRRTSFMKHWHFLGRAGINMNNQSRSLHFLNKGPSTPTKVEIINHRDPWESLVAQLRGIKIESFFVRCWSNIILNP